MWWVRMRKGRRGVRVIANDGWNRGTRGNGGMGTGGFELHGWAYTLHSLALMVW